MVEQPAVNRLVAGSNPARGANLFKKLARSFKACESGPKPSGVILAMQSATRLAKRKSPTQWPIDPDGDMAGNIAPGERYTNIRQPVYPHRLDCIVVSCPGSARGPTSRMIPSFPAIAWTLAADSGSTTASGGDGMNLSKFECMQTIFTPQAGLR